MKKNIAIFSFLIAGLFLLTGCSQTQNSSAGNRNKPDSGGDYRASGRRMPDFGQPEKPADIRGVVKSITGNEATIIKIDTPANGRNASSSQEKPADNQTGATQDRPSVSLSGSGVPSGGRMMGGGPGEPGRNNTESSRATMLENLKAMSSGEEKVVVPVGIQMLKSNINSDSKKVEMVAATLEDITADKMITVWLNASSTDKKIAEFILIN